jgi:uncharacterized damage-inducible protein DinB
MKPIELPLMRTRACLALAEETEAAREALYSLLPQFPEEAFRTGNVETEDNVRGILCHVTFAIFSYACWIARVLGRLDPAIEKEEKAAFLVRVRSCTSADQFEQASREASARYYVALAEVLSDELDKDFKTNWGPMISIEAMLEHAMAHLMRHRRQLEVYAGIREPGRILEG